MRIAAATGRAMTSALAISASVLALAGRAPAEPDPQQAYRRLAERVFQAGGYVNLLWEWAGPRPPNGDHAPYFRRLREMGIWGTSLRYGQGRPLWTAPRDLGFPHYVETTTGVILHGPESKEYAAANKAFGEADDPAAAKGRLLARRPCLSDPALHARTTKAVEALVAESAKFEPVFYCLGAEIGLGPHGAASPVCFSDHCLAGFRRWLKTQYAGVAALNREWDTEFKSLDEVVPLTLREVAARVRRTGADNFAPFVDHRRFMDTVLVRYYGRCRQIIDRRAPAAGGVLMVRALAQTGWDLWAASRACRMIEHNDINYHADQHELIRSFAGPDGFWLRAHELEYGQVHDVYNTWRRVLGGYNAAVLFETKTQKLFDRAYPDYPPRPRGKLLQPAFRAWRGGLAGQLAVLGPDDSAVRILYSRDSEHARWAQDGWRDNYYADSSTRNHYDDALCLHAREAWCYLLEDLGLQYRYVSYEQLAAGDLPGCRLLVLPECEALSKKQCQQVEAFVRRGGTVVADCFAAGMDEHGRRLPKGRLDDLFGIRRPQPGKSTLLKTGMRLPSGGTYEQLMARRFPHRLTDRAGAPTTATGDGFDAGRPSRRASMVKLPKGVALNVPAVEAGLAYADDVTHLAEAPGAKAFAVRQVGKGRAVFLNLRMLKYLFIDPYPDFRYSARGDGARAVARGVLQLAGVKPRFQVRHEMGRSAAPVEIFAFDDPRQAGGATLVALTPNYHFGGCTLPGSRKACHIDGKQLKHDPYPARLAPAGGAERHCYDALAGKYLGRLSAVDVSIDPARPVLLARLPYKVESLEMKFATARTPGAFRGEVTLKAGAPVKCFAPHVIRIDLLGKDDGAEPLGRRFVVCDRAGKASGVEVAVSPAKWRGPAGRCARIRATDVLTGVSAEPPLRR